MTFHIKAQHLFYRNRCLNIIDNSRQYLIKSTSINSPKTLSATQHEVIPFQNLQKLKAFSTCCLDEVYECMSFLQSATKYDVT